MNIAAMIAVAGTQISIAMLPTNADSISVATWLRLKNLFKSILLDSKTSGKELPRYTKINVFDIVPIMSFPTFIPDLNNSDADKLLFVSRISLMVDATDTEVSINAPSAAIIIDAAKIPVKFKSGLEAYKKIFFSCKTG